MSITLREPWQFLNQFNRNIGVVGANSSTVSFIPAVDVREEKERFVVQADLPGVAPTDIDVTAEKGVLTLRGERKQEKREESTGYERIECVSGSFTRRFALPENVQADAIKARFTHGVLEVSIPKQPEVAAKRVVVEAA